MPQVDEKKLFKKLDEIGEKEVRIQLAKGVFGSWKVESVKLWLLEQDKKMARLEAEWANSAASRADSAANEDRLLSRSAHRAAWIAAIAAITAIAWGIIDSIFFK